MLVGSAYTLYKMRKKPDLRTGKALKEVREARSRAIQAVAHERYMSSKTVLGLIG